MNTHGRPGSLKWILYWFPEYVHNGRPIYLKRGQGRVYGRKTTAETSPWRYAERRPGLPTIYGFIETEAQSIWPWRRYVRKPMNDVEYAEFMQSLRWDSHEGLDPRLLIGGWRSVRSGVYHCNDGAYTPKTRSEPARFMFRDGAIWVGDA